MKPRSLGIPALVFQVVPASPLALVPWATQSDINSSYEGISQMFLPSKSTFCCCCCFVTALYEQIP